MRWMWVWFPGCMAPNGEDGTIQGLFKLMHGAVRGLRVLGARGRQWTTGE